MVGKFLVTAGRSARRLMQEHCQEASDLADQLGLGPAVCEPLLQAFERWDGRYTPDRPLRKQTHPNASQLRDRRQRRQFATRTLAGGALVSIHNALK